MDYTEVEAVSYRTLGVDGSTYGVSLIPALDAMGDLSGKTVLDYGCGTGRTAIGLCEHGARQVVAVDNDANMLHAAQLHPHVNYREISNNCLPLPDRSFQGAFCANVFSEFRNRDDIFRACREIWRTLVPGSTFVVVVTNPDSLGCDFVSYRYDDVINPRSGAPLTCRIKGAKPFTIQDYYWSTDDYVSTVDAAGFEIEDLMFPVAPGGGNWLDETKTAPDLVIVSTRVSQPRRRTTSGIGPTARTVGVWPTVGVTPAK